MAPNGAALRLRREGQTLRRRADSLGAVAIPGAESMFSRDCDEILRATATPGRSAAVFSGFVVSLPGADVSEQPDPTARIAPRKGRDPGRGINIFKGLREILRATATPGRSAAVFSGLVVSVAGADVSEQPDPTARITPRKARNPGRGINVFKGLREIFRAIAKSRCLATVFSDLVVGAAGADVSDQPDPTAPIIPRRGRNPRRGINVFKRLREILRTMAPPERPSAVFSGLVVSIAGDQASDQPDPTARMAPRSGRNPGRGINVFKGLREILRARAPPGRLATVFSGLVVGVAGGGLPDQTDPTARIAPRKGRNPGRGINVFKGLRQILRARAPPGRPRPFSRALSSASPEAACRTSLTQPPG